MADFNTTEDLTTWSAQQTPTVTGGQDSPDGATNASIVEDDDPASSEAIYKVITPPPSDTEAVSRVFWIKRGTNNFNSYPAVRVRFDSGGSSINTNYGVDLETGETWAVGGAQIGGSCQVKPYGDWWKLTVTAVNNGTGNTRELAYLYPAYATDKSGASDNTAVGAATFFLGDETPLSIYEGKFVEWAFSEANGVRVGPRPVASTPLEQGDIFISTTGTGVGTAGDPASLMNGATLATAGQTVFLRGGVYILDNEKWIPSGGTVGNPITYESYPGELAIFETDPATIPVDPKDALAFVWIENEHTILRRIESRIMAQTGVEVRGSNCELHGIYAHNNGNSGVALRNPGIQTDNTLVQDCIFKDNSDVGREADGGTADGINLHSGTGNIIRYCEADGNSDDGIDVWGGINSLVEYCVAHDQGLASGDGNGFKMGGDPISTGNTARYCLAYGNLKRGFDDNTTAYATAVNCSAGSNGTVDFKSNATTTFERNVATGSLTVSLGTMIDNSWDRAAGMAYVSTIPYNTGFMVPVAGYEDIGAMVPEPTAPPVLSAPTVDETGDGATLTIDSNSDAGTLWSYSKTTAFTGTEAENAAEIMANGVGQAPVIGENTRVVTGQDVLTPHYAGWVQDAGTVESNVVLVQYTTLDTPARPVMTQQYPDRLNYSGSPIAPVDLGAPYWASTAGPLFFREVGLPFGLTIDENTGIVTGTSSGNASANVDIYASNTLGETITPGEFVWKIEIPPVVVPPEGAGLSLSLSLWV